MSGHHRPAGLRSTGRPDMTRRNKQTLCSAYAARIGRNGKQQRVLADWMTQRETESCHLGPAAERLNVGPPSRYSLDETMLQ